MLYVLSRELHATLANSVKGLPSERIVGIKAGVLRAALEQINVAALRSESDVEPAAEVAEPQVADTDSLPAV